MGQDEAYGCVTKEWRTATELYRANAHSLSMGRHCFGRNLMALVKNKRIEAKISDKLRNGRGLEFRLFPKELE